MARMLRSWLMFMAVVLCLLVCWSGFADAYPPKPESPGTNASPEDWAKYHAAVRHYVNLITRQRSGSFLKPFFKSSEQLKNKYNEQINKENIKKITMEIGLGL